VRVLFVFIVIGLYHIPATWFILFYVAIDLLSQASDILGRPSDVANAAHLGGYLFGFSTAIALLGIGILPRTDLDALYLLKQRQRRRAMRQVARDHGSAFEGPSTSAPVPSKVRGNGETAPPPADPDAPQRAAIADALRHDDGDTAIRLYGAGPPNLRLPDGMLADLGNRAMASGDVGTSIRAYTQLLDRRGDRSNGDGGPTDDFRLLLASLLIRRANRPEEARPLLTRLTESRLSPQAVTLRDALLAEIDPGNSSP
jgi:hypothetical protein